MLIKNTRYHYGIVTRSLHWLVALLVIGQILVGFYTTTFADPSAKSWLMFLHKSVGLTILWLMLLRIIWVFTNRQPGYEARVPLWQRALARLIHFLLYILLLALPISGWIMSTAADRTPSYFGLFNLPLPGIPVSKALASTADNLHVVLVWIAIALVVLHIAAGLKHHFINRDNVLRRMWHGQ